MSLLYWGAQKHTALEVGPYQCRVGGKDHYLLLVTFPKASRTLLYCKCTLMAHIHLSHQDPCALFCTFFSAHWTLPQTGAWSCSSPRSLNFLLLNFWRFPSDNSSVDVPVDVSTTLFGLSAHPTSLLRVHLCVTPRSVTKVLNRIGSGTEPQGTLLVTSHQLFSHLKHCATDANPLSPSGQTVSSRFHRSPTWHALHWFVYKDAMGDRTENLTEVNINNVHCSALIYPANLITQGG